MKNTIIALSLSLFVSAAFAQESKMQTTPGIVTPIGAIENKNAPDIKFDIETYDFGTIKQGDKVSHDFEFANTGKEPLIITGANGSCGCTVPLWPKEPISKGAKGTINVEFNSTGKMGMQDKTVTIVSNAKSGQRILRLKGNVETPTATPATETPGTEKK